MLTEGNFSSESLCVVGNLNRVIKLAPLRQGTHLVDEGEHRNDVDRRERRRGRRQRRRGRGRARARGRRCWARWEPTPWDAA